MADDVIDTNVLLCASTADEGSPFDGADHVPESERTEVLEWLSVFRGDPERRLVIDEAFQIYEEYRNKLTDQDYGLLVINEKLQTAEPVPVDYDSDGHGVVPEDLAALDASDRKLAAAAIAATILRETSCTLANATDTDWYPVEVQLTARGVILEQILETWCRAKYEEKRRRKAL